MYYVAIAAAPVVTSKIEHTLSFINHRTYACKFKEIIGKYTRDTPNAGEERRGRRKEQGLT